MPFDINDMSVLDRRRIEALALGPLIREFEKEIGREKAHEIARRAIVGIAIEQGKQLAERLGKNDMQTFSDAKEPWTRGGALEIEPKSESADSVAFDVTRCRYAEMYRELGMADLGGILSCGRDATLATGFNSAIKLKRTQTIMEGASHCDFHYTIDNATPESTSKG